MSNAFRQQEYICNTKRLAIEPSDKGTIRFHSTRQEMPHVSEKLSMPTMRLLSYSAHLSAQKPDALPKRLQDIIKGLNAVWSSCLCQGCNGQRCDGLDLLVLVHQPVLDDIH